MKNIKLTALILLVAMLLTMFVSCSDNNSKDKNEDGPTDAYANSETVRTKTAVWEKTENDCKYKVIAAYSSDTKMISTVDYSIEVPNTSPEYGEKMKNQKGIVAAFERQNDTELTHEVIKGDDITEIRMHFGKLDESDNEDRIGWAAEVLDCGYDGGDICAMFYGTDMNADNFNADLVSQGFIEQ